MARPAATHASVGMEVVARMTPAPPRSCSSAQVRYSAVYCTYMTGATSSPGNWLMLPSEGLFSAPMHVPSRSPSAGLTV